MRNINFIAGWLGLVLLSIPAFSQTEGVDTVAQVIEPYALVDITQNLQKSRDLITEADSRTSDLEEYEDALNDFGRIDSLLNITLPTIDTSLISVSEANVAQTEISGYISDLSSLEEKLNSITVEFDATRTSLVDDKTIWDVTLAKLKEDAAPQTVVENVSSLIQDFERLDDTIVRRMDEIFQLQSAISDRKGDADAIITTIAAYQKNLADRIFKIDTPPIWQVKIDSSAYSRFVKSIKSNTVTAFDGTIKYLQINRDILLFHVVVVIILLISLIYLNRKREKLATGWSKELLVMMKNPLSLALLLSILIVGPYYESYPQPVVRFVILLSFAITISILLPLVSSRSKLLLIILAIVFIFNLFLGLISEYGIWARLVFVLEALVSGYLLLRVFNRGVRKYKTFNLQLGHWMMFLIPVGVVGLVLSIISSLIGATSFARFLLFGVTDVIIFSVILFVSGLVLRGMAFIILRSPRATTMYLTQENAHKVEKRTSDIIQALLFVFFLSLIAQSFRFYEPVKQWLIDSMEFDIGIGNSEISIGAVLGFIFTIFISFWLAKLIQLILERELLQRLTLPKGIPNILSTFTYYFIVVAGFFMALSQIGFNAGQISIVIGALGVGIGFGLQNIISNLVSGIILAFERPIREGDTVEVGALMGTVRSIGIRSSKVRTYDGSEVIVPNNNLISNEVINWTLSDVQRRSTVHIGVAYGSSPKEVSEILMKVALEHEKTLKSPEPMVIFEGFGDSSIDFKLHFWTLFDDGYTSKSQVAIEIYEALNEAGIEIPFPQRVVTINKDEAEKD